MFVCLLVWCACRRVQGTSGSYQTLETVPWVFTYNDESPAYDYLMRSSVISALQIGKVKPFCLFRGSNESEVARFLKANGVELIHHHIAWADALWEALVKSSWSWSKRVRLAETRSELIGAFQRIDIALYEHLFRAECVLFTDIDVLFLRHVSFQEVSRLQTDYVLMPQQSARKFPYNSGVMLMNLTGLRRTHAAFLQFILSNVAKHGGKFPLGPVDQGAYNTFYKESLLSKPPLDSRFQACPLDPVFINNSLIIHFRGPKPHQYFKFQQVGTCTFQHEKHLCKRGIARLCEYINVTYWHTLCEAASIDLSNLCSAI